MKPEAQLFDSGEAFFEINPSRLQTYLDCPRAYRYRYVDRRPERRSFPQTSLGRSVHRALRDFYGLVPPERTWPALIRQLRHAWDPSGHRTRAAAESALVRAEEMLRRYYDLEDHRQVRAIALESKFYMRKDGIYVWGRVDRIDALGDEYVLVDYKTGTFRTDQKAADHSMALSLYAMAASHQFGRPVTRIVLYHLASGEKIQTSRDAARIAQDYQELVKVVSDMRSASNYPARTGPLCRWCDFAAVCPEGSLVAGPIAL